MSKELLKKAGILGVTFGLMASPLAFADTTDHSSIDQNQDAMEEDHSAGTHTHGEATDSYDTEDLTTDEGTQGPDNVDEPTSTNVSGDEEYTPDDVVDQNSGD
ncbi:MAG: hypothetical protein EA345_01070 [Halomonas sp.]|nr:hypothetical protein [Halomonas sp.]TVP52280.1 MAG: hypothetical protein EA345_01070 [Halomonas sp.]